MNRLRDTPTSTGYPSATSRASSDSIAIDVAPRLANPMPGSTTIRSRRDAGAQRAADRARAAPSMTSPTGSSPYVACANVAMSATSPRECIRTTPAPAARAHARHRGVEPKRRRRRSRSTRRPRAPRRATAAFTVSTEIGTAGMICDAPLRTTGIDAAQLLLRVDGSRALRPRRLAADVDDVGALGDQPVDVSPRVVDASGGVRRR